jgi:hypothetical protein
VNAVLDSGYQRPNTIGFPVVLGASTTGAVVRANTSSAPSPEPFGARRNVMSVTTIAPPTKKLIIGVDIDGVLARFEGGFIPLLRRVTGKRLIPNDYDPQVWQWPTQVGYSKDEEAAAWATLKVDPFFWYSLPVLPDAPSFLGALKDSEHDVYFITNRMGVNVKRQTELWLEPYYSRPTVLITPHKGLAARTLSLDSYIDDKRENCLEVATIPGVRVYMPRRQYNTLADPHPQITPVHSILEMLEHEGIFYSLGKRAA